MKRFLAGLLVGVALAASTGAFASGRSAQVVPATAGEQLIAKKLDITNQRLLLNYIELGSVSSKLLGIGFDTRDIKSNTEKACAYLRNIYANTRFSSTLCY